MQPNNQIRIYTDGSANCKTRDGAWAFVAVLPDGVEVEKYQAYSSVTNNQMELMAVLEALAFIQDQVPQQPAGTTFEIISDSEYVVKGVNFWRKTWIRKNWKDVKNPLLWRTIDNKWNYLEERNVPLTISWVRGHAGDIYNEKCDKLANSAYRKLAESKK